MDPLQWSLTPRRNSIGGRTTPMPLIVTGSIGIDTVHTPVATAEEVLGGSAAYFGAAASLVSPDKVRIVAAAGEDLTQAHRDLLGAFPNLCLDGLELRKGSKTFRWGGRYHDNMNVRDTLFTELNILAETPPTPPASYADSRYVFLANTHPQVQRELLGHFPDRHIAVADTMDLWIDTASKELLALLKEVDGVVLNDQEAAHLTGERNPLTAGRRILELGPSFAVIKKGEHGSLLIHKRGVASLPAFPMESVVDPTGAGDSFAGGMMAHIARAHSASGGEAGSIEAIRAGIALGTVVATFALESFSLDRLRDTTPEQVRERFEQFRRVVAVE